ncbi:C-C motif chemokine 25 isoform X2 [Tachyglossus aculeatus]|uniref:C-C motif chemokine 25 isoform X2 n=1 Tax=Tachyglossus aculeatus TaxID=9261 RepID=UPI0018F4D86A|nr:C-C motif chemokine 25 isoform X2 [Tachyglossus aculeatus]
MKFQVLILLIVAYFHIGNTQGSYEDCCLSYHTKISRRMLPHIRRYTIQRVNGSCNLHAVIFHLRRTKVLLCGNPQEEWVKLAKKRVDERSRHSKKLQGVTMTRLPHPRATLHFSTTLQSSSQWGQGSNPGRGALGDSAVNMDPR